MIANNKKKAFVFISILLSSTLGIIFLSKASSLFPWYMNDDTDIFMTIGKYWASGEAIPYLDLFDHKGPIIFLINAIGFYIGHGNNTGLVVIEVLFLFITEYFAYKVLTFKFNNRVSVLLSLLMPLFFIYNFVPGNFTEEYMLPFIFISFYMCLKWQNSNSNKHNEKYALFYGMSFGFALMTRVTNALSICLLVLYIALFLVKNKEYRNLFTNILFFVLGIILIVIPFCIYFYQKGILYDMWYATILYNFDYASNSGIEMQKTLKDIISLIRMTFFGLFAIAVLSYQLIVKKRKDTVIWLLVAIPSTAYMFMLNRYANYSLILLPLLYIGFIFSDFDRKMIIICLLLLSSSAIKIRKMCIENRKENVYNLRQYRDLTKEIPAIEINEHLVFFDPIVDTYLLDDIKPCSKYFIFQTWQASNSAKLTEKIRNEYKNNKNIHYIITGVNPILIKDILDEDFKHINELGMYNLYVRIR